MKTLLSFDPAHTEICIREARARIERYFDQNEEVVVNFSFGKDSLLLTLLCYEIALRRNELHKLTLQTVELDDFLMHDNAVKWNAYVKTQIPVKWVLYRPTLIVHPVVLVIGLGQYAPRRNYPRCPWKNIFKTRALMNKKSLLGLRADESAKRNRLIHDSDGAPDAPLHDVPEEAVWGYLEDGVEKIGIDFKRLTTFYATKRRDGCLFCPFNMEGYDHQWQYELVERYRFFRDMLIKGNLLDRPMRHTKFLSPPRIPFSFRYTYLLDEVRAIERKFAVEIVTKPIQRILDEIRQFYTLYGEFYCWSDVKNRYEEYLDYALYPDEFQTWFAVNKHGCRVVVWHTKTNVVNANNAQLYEDRQ